MLSDDTNILVAIAYISSHQQSVPRGSGPDSDDPQTVKARVKWPHQFLTQHRI